MRMNRLAAVCLAGMVALSGTAFAQSDRNKPAGAAGTTQGTTAAPSVKETGPTGPGRQARPPGGLTVAPLTTAECKGLGGKLAESNRCATGQDCIRADQDGVLHHSCITKQ
jgi:hypothetical protein